MIISIDIGGTNTRIGASLTGTSIDSVKKFPTASSYKKTLEAIIKEIEILGGGKKIKAIVLGVPGALNKNKTKIVIAPNLPGWKNQSPVKDLSQVFKCKVFMENDTDLGGLGESAYGAGKGYDIVAYLAIGTGFGGSRIVRDRLDVSSQGFEPGHMIINYTAKSWLGCGQSGCLESFVSGLAIKKHYNIDKASDCSDDKVWDEIGKLLAVGLVNITTLWSPDCIIIGGGVAKSGNKLLRPTRNYLKEYLNVLKAPPIKLSKLKDKSNMYGGLHYIKSIKNH